MAFLQKSSALGSVSAALAAGVLLAGCAVSVPPDAGQNPADPYESFNRHMYAFNTTLDRYVAKPVAQAYVDWTPSFLRDRVHSAVDNLFEPSRALNNTLQGKIDDGVSSAFRFLINTTFGIAGLVDVASWIEIESKPEDFGQTLGKWGVPPGPYIVLPFLGPSTARDVSRYVEEVGTNPVTYAFWNENWWLSSSLTVVGLVDKRAELLKLETIRQSTLDEYVAVREAYLSARENAIRDGEPQDEEEELQSLTPLDFDDAQ